MQGRASEDRLPTVTNPTQHGSSWIAVTFVVAFLLTELPLPDWAALWRPGWVTLVLIYWCMAVPERIGVGVGWMSGLVLDVLMGTVLGQHALALSVVAFLTLKLHRRVRVLPIWQQGLTVFVLLMIDHVLVLWINGIQGRPVESLAYWASPLTSTLLWPWVFIILRDMRRKRGVT
jgi:rod shape-determining protein MreD